jgi:uncharacterized protein YkwD
MLLAPLQAAGPGDAFARKILEAHNAVRRQAGVRPLVWSDKLAAYALEWARTLLAQNRFAHRGRSPYGENLFEVSGTTANPAQVVDTWAAESKLYDYGSNVCHRGPCGHYTQIVWRDSKEVGCAVAGGVRRQVWVCNYCPPGNVAGRRPY